MTRAPWTVEHRLPGWRLFWVRLEVLPGAEAAAAELRRAAGERCRREWTAGALAEDAVGAAVRRLFREAGTDPTRYRPSSEALIRRLLKGEELPAIHPLVDLNNALSAALAVPACVMPEGSFGAPVVLRRGEAGERYDSLRGDFDLAGKPLLADPAGPFGTPITDSRRVKVGAEATAAWMVAYLPASSLPGAHADRALDELLAAFPVAAATFRFLSSD